MAQRQIEGIRAIVTGASSGIGREIARQLASQGARVVITARREERLIELANEINGDVHVVAGDVSIRDDRDRVLDAVKTQLGGLDLLVNNAGITGIGPFMDADEARLRRIMEVNFFAPLELIRAAGPLLRQGNRPMIVNVSSVLAHRAVPKKSEYCASKFALHGFSDALRAELKPLGIDVLLVSPSTTQSEIFDRAIGDKSQLAWIKSGATPADKVARATLKAIRRGKHEVILTLGGKALVWLDRLCPTIANYLVARYG